MEPPYSNRELGEKFEAVHGKLDRIERKIDFTNGKVKKITLALVLLSGVCLGLGMEQVRPFLTLLI